MEKEIVVTLSWDDGHKLDLKFASLLKKYGLKGTFYISPDNREWEKDKLLSNEEIYQLSKDFEIGCHTMTHKRLTKIKEDEAYREILDSKLFLEGIINKEIKSFSYPEGGYNKKVINLVKMVGLTIGRTSRRYSFKYPLDPLALETTLHTYNHISDLFRILKFSKFNLAEFYKNLDWENLAKRFFDSVLKTGGVYHLWGHSREIDARNQWGKLENVLTYISGKKNIRYLTNSEIIAIDKKKTTRIKIVNICIQPSITPNYGGAIRTYSLNKYLKKEFEVSTFALSRRNPFLKIKRSRSYVEQYFFFPLFSLLAFPLWFFKLPHDFILSFITKFQKIPKRLAEEISQSDIIQVEFPYLVKWIRKYFGNKKIIFDSHNVEYDLEKDNLKGLNFILRKIILHFVKNIEIEALRYSDVVLAVSLNNKKRFVDLYKINADKIKIIPNGTDIPFFSKNIFKDLTQKIRKEFIGKKVLVFVGSEHKPNKEAVKIIKDKIAPYFEKDTEIIFLIVGSVSNKKNDKNIYYTGKVKDIRPFLKISDIALNPMVSGSGTNIKMLELMSVGIPIITTPKGARGLNIKNNQQAIICPIGNFTKKIEFLINDNKLREELTRNSLVSIKKYSWEYIVGKLINIYRKIGNYS
jgi:peptidoglycan-N-acetylglucosamine deacetylase